MGREAEPISNFVVFPVATLHPEFDFKTVVKKKFGGHFVPKHNFIHDCACFHKRNQRTNETMEAFVRSLYELLQHCEFGSSKYEQIPDKS